MSASATVDQLLNGVRVRLADGDEVVCKPLTLAQGIKFVDLYDRRSDPAATAAERAQARLDVVRLFAQVYPELVPRISGGDVEALIPDFFWSTSGAEVLLPEANGTSSTGTTPGASTSPATSDPPTP